MQLTKPINHLQVTTKAHAQISDYEAQEALTNRWTITIKPVRGSSKMGPEGGREGTAPSQRSAPLMKFLVNLIKPLG